MVIMTNPTRERSTAVIKTIIATTTTTSLMRMRNHHQNLSPHTMGTRGIMLFILVRQEILLEMALMFIFRAVSEN